MDATLWPLLLALAALIALDVTALRWGRDSRRSDGSERAWW